MDRRRLRLHHTPNKSQVGKRLRVMATFQDGTGESEAVTSDPTAEEVKEGRPPPPPPPDPRVPNVTRLGVDTARLRLKIEGPWHIVVHKRMTAQEPAGSVLAQRPRPGHRLAEGRRVVLLVAAGDICDPSYPGPCIAPEPPDLDCAQVGVTNFVVVGSDPHGFDGDNDGVGCEA